MKRPRLLDRRCVPYSWAKVMFRQRTVFVVGAGSSCELGLPSGDGLMLSIAQHLAANSGPHGFSHDAILRPLIERIKLKDGGSWSHKMQQYREKAAQICKAMPYARSIDTYLESQRDDEETVFLGKLAIAQAILQAENGSALSLGQGEQGATKLAKSWYPPLSRILTSGHQAGDIANLFANVSFIVFNYDRCLELFLLRMIRDYFGVEGDASKILASATIVHAYGQVGKLVQGNGFVPFGGNDETNLAVVADGIKTYTESADAGTTKRIRSLVEEADTIVFMGFGFLAQNVKLLSPEHGSQVKQVMATTFEMSPQDQEAVRLKLVNSLGQFGQTWAGEQRIEVGRRETFRNMFENGKCRDLMNNNIFSLADQ